jgi:hypothetical protein
MCIYCGVRPSVKREHVVAKVFFDVLPPNVPTVPSCHECDSGMGDGEKRPLHHDEEYMRNVMCMSERAVQASETVRKLGSTKLLGSFRNSIPLAISVLNRSRPVYLKNRSGIIIPRVEHAYTVETSRVKRVVRKIVRGLHFKKYKAPLDFDAEIKVTFDLRNEDFHLFHSFITEVPWETLGNEVFLWKSAPFGDKPGYGIWLMVFYKVFGVFALTKPRD